MVIIIIIIIIIIVLLCLGGLYLEGLIHGGAYFRNFTVTDLWITSLLFDLNYEFINESFAFSPG